MQPLWKTAWKFLKLKTELPYDPGFPLLGIYPKKKTKQKYKFKKIDASLCSQQNVVNMGAN